MMRRFEENLIVMNKEIPDSSSQVAAKNKI